MRFEMAARRFHHGRSARTRRCACSAGFQACRIAGFQAGREPKPPGAGQLQVARIHYGKSTQSTGTRNVTVDIFDFNMNRVRTLIHNAARSTTSEYDEVWDGRCDNGTQASNGVYFYRVKIDDNDPLYGKILLLQ